MKNDNEKATATLTGSELRDRSWRLINAANLDYSPKYIGNDADPGAEAIDGLIRTPMGYYRLAEDMRDGTRILLHSYERKQLEGIKRDGIVTLPEMEDKDTDIYGVTARKGVRGAIFREDMNHDVRFLERCFQKDLNLHFEDKTPQPDNPEQPAKKVFKLANGKMAFGVFETDDGKWRVRFYNNVREQLGKVGGFVTVDEKAPSGFTGKVFSLGQDMQDFDSRDEAFLYIRRYWKTASLRLFKGRKAQDEALEYLKRYIKNRGKYIIDGTPIPPDTSKMTPFQAAKLYLYSRVTNFMDEKHYRDWAVAVPVGVVAGFLSAAASGTILAAALGLGVTATWVFGAKTVENFVYHNWTRSVAVRDNKAIEALLPYFEQNQIEKYLTQDPNNERRFRRKVGPENMQHLRLLNHDEADMVFDDGELAPSYNLMRDFERVSTAPYRYFGAQFDSTNHEHGVLVGVFPNGLISLIQVDVDTRAVRHYVQYNDKFDIMNGRYKHLDPSLTELPGKGPIHKITHRKGKDFRYTPVTGEEFIADLMHKVGNADKVRDFQAFGMPLKELFNVKSIDAIEPAPKEAKPVSKWVANRRPRKKGATAAPAALVAV